MACSGVVTAQFVASKATRDALYLAHLDVTTLPAMIAATSAFSILIVIASSKTLRRLTPGTFVPLAFAASGVLLLLEWALATAAPTLAAPIIYLQISGVGPMLGSGFWLITSERFDPRSAKRRFGQIGGAGTLGGLAGGLLSERVAAALDVAAMLPILAALNLVCAWLVLRLAASPTTEPHEVDIAPELASEPPRSGLRVLAEARYLRNLAALVLLGTAAAALVDYAFKAQAVASFGRGEALLRFFALYYAATSLITFLVQASASRSVLEKLGIAVSAGTPSVALLLGGAGALAVPGLGAATFARGIESVLRGSLFRSGYEVFYTPIPPVEKRAAKSLIDVGFDRMGDAAGAGLVRIALMLAPASQTPAILALAVGLSAAALVVASRLNRGYIATLERSLLNRRLELDLTEVYDTTTRTVMLRASPLAARSPTAAADHPAGDSPVAAQKSLAASIAGSLDVDMLQMLALRSRDRDRVLRALDPSEPVPASLVGEIIPLLGWDAVADRAVETLRRAADAHVGQMIDALLDPNQDFAVRRRLARVFSGCRSQRAADGLALGLNDSRFEVRFECARSLAAIVRLNPGVRIDRDLIFAVVQRETAVGVPVWESHRLLDQLDDRGEHFFVDEFVKDRASRSLTHVFTLLSLVLPPEPLRIAFRGLHTDDPNLRGTALEYLEEVLPPVIRAQLWPFLEDSRPDARRDGQRPREEILADLLRSHESIVLNLEELQKRLGRLVR
jgi:hypothetical protein